MSNLIVELWPGLFPEATPSKLATGPVYKLLRPDGLWSNSTNIAWRVSEIYLSKYLLDKES